MPPRPIRVAASLLVCLGALVAADSYDDVADGSDIHEGIYGSHGGGEFDEWRLHLGLAPGIDRIRLSSEINGAPYPGPSGSEKDRVVNDPVLAPQIGLTWLLGDFEGPDHGWFYTLGLEYTKRSYKIIYEIGAESVPLELQSVTAQIGMGYAWYFGRSWRYEFEPLLSAGLMWNELDLVNLATFTPSKETSPGPVIEGIVRNALIWHPGSQAWHLGASIDYRAGYANTEFSATTAAGDTNSTVSLWWHGFGYTAFYGHKF